MSEPPEPPEPPDPLGRTTTFPAVPAPNQQPHPARAFVTLLAAPASEDVGRVFSLERGDHELGRSSGASIHLPDPGVSRRHALLRLDPDGNWTLEDLASRNGTYVNNVPICHATLGEGDKIRLGPSTLLRFSLREPDDGELRLQQAVSAGEIGTWEWDIHTRRLSWSGYVERMFGLGPGSMRRMSEDLTAFIHAEDRPRVLAAFDVAADQGARCDLEYRIVGPGGALRWVSCRGALIRGTGGRPIRITGTLSDISDRKQQDDELRRQALMFENLCDGVVVLDLSGRVVDWNASAEQMFGYSKQEVLGRPMAEVLGASDPGGLSATVAALDKGDRFMSELQLRAKGGRELTCEATVMPLRDSDGRCLGHIAVHRDLTERRQMQARLLITDRLSSLGTLAAGVAHEINNPLAFISANLAYLLEEMKRLAPVAERARVEELLQVLRETQEGAGRIRNIVSALKSFSRDDPEQGAELIDVGQAFELAIKMAEHEIRHRARLVRQISEECWVLGSPSRLGQVLLNVLINAAQAIPEGDRQTNEIRVAARREGGRVVIEIQDSGVGMSSEVLGRIFDPFYTTKPVGVGTGLGLSVSHGIVAAMGGELTAESEPGQGSCFRIALPAADPERLPTLPPRPSTAERAPRRARLLVIDDEPMVGSSLQRLLAREHDVTALARAREALDRLRAGERFDLILCDLMMPDLSGMDFFPQLGLLGGGLDERVVFMTGGAFTPRAKAFLESVKNPVLRKPIDPGLLRRLIREQLTKG